MGVRSVSCVEKNAGSASGGVILTLEAEDRLDHLRSTCRKYGNPYLIFPAVCAKIVVGNAYKRQGIAGGNPLYPYDECPYHSTQQSFDCTVALLYPPVPAFARAETGRIGPIVLRSDFRAVLSLYARHRTQRPGEGANLSPEAALSETSFGVRANLNK